MNSLKTILIPFLAAAGTALAAGETAAVLTPAQEAIFTINNVWVLIGGMLVFLMHLGFATLEAGLCRAKNCTNVLFKNTLVPAIGFITYAVCGFSLMYPGEANWLLGKVIGFAGFGMGADPDASIAAAYAYNGGKFTYWSDFFFQGMFAATAATIVSGAVAGRGTGHRRHFFLLRYVL